MPDALSAAREAFLAAPLSEDGWDRALQVLSTHTGAAHGQIVAFGDDFTVPFNVMTNVDAGWYQEFHAIDGANPAVNWRLPLARAPFEIISERHYDVVREGYRGNIYDDFAIRHDMVDGCQTVLAREPNAFFGLATVRQRRDGRTTPQQLAYFGMAAAFALAAVRMQIALHNQAASLVTRTLEAMRAAVFVVDRQGCVIDHTPMADALLSEGIFLGVKDGMLHAHRPHEQRELLLALGRVSRSVAPGDECAALWLSGGGDGTGGRRCEVFRLPTREWAFSARPLFLVVVRSARPTGATALALLRAAFHLTSAEAEVALLLAEGQSREAIAILRRTSQHTVKTQIKSIFDKTGVSRESTLVALMQQALR